MSVLDLRIGHQYGESCLPMGHFGEIQLPGLRMPELVRFLEVSLNRLFVSELEVQQTRNRFEFLKLGS